MECVRYAIADSRTFVASAAFEPWVNIFSAEQCAFEGRYAELFTAHLARKKETSTVTCSGSASSSVVAAAAVSATSGADHSKRKVNSNLASLLGWKRDQKDVECSSSEKKTANHWAKGNAKSDGGSKRS